MDNTTEIDWKKIQSKDNSSIEELTQEEQQILQEYERQQTEIQNSEMPLYLALIYSK